MSCFSLFVLRTNLEEQAKLPAGNQRNRGLLARNCGRDVRQPSINDNHITNDKLIIVQTYGFLFSCIGLVDIVPWYLA